MEARDEFVLVAVDAVQAVRRRLVERAGSVLEACAATAASFDSAVGSSARSHGRSEREWATEMERARLRRRDVE